MLNTGRIESLMDYLSELNNIQAKSTKDMDDKTKRINAVSNAIEKELGIREDREEAEGYRPRTLTYDETHESQCLDWNDCKIIARALGDRRRLVLEKDLEMNRKATEEDTKYYNCIERLEKLFDSWAQNKRDSPPGVNLKTING